MRITLPLATLALATQLAGCGVFSGVSSPEADSPTETAGTPAPKADAETRASAVTLKTSVVKGRGCNDRPRGDLAWFNATVEVHEDLDEIAFDLFDNEGVSQVGQAQVLFPVNRGGQIILSGEATWDGRKSVFRRSGTVQPDPELADDWFPTAGESALVVLRLRFDDAVQRGDDVASMKGLRATYQRPDETTGTAEVALDEEVRFDKGCLEE